MAEKTEKNQKPEKQEKQKKSEGPAKAEKKQPQQEEHYESLVRILGYDIPGSKNILAGLTRIKGVSWSISNITCIKLKIPFSKRISELSKPEIQEIESFLKKMPVPDFLKNRRKDIETGETRHYLGSDLDIKKEFDIKRLREIKSYRGLRHALKLPVRGQRTRSHFRTKGTTMGVKRKAAGK